MNTITSYQAYLEKSFRQHQYQDSWVKNFQEAVEYLQGTDEDSDFEIQDINYALLNFRARICVLTGELVTCQINERGGWTLLWKNKSGIFSHKMFKRYNFQIQ